VASFTLETNYGAFKRANDAKQNLFFEKLNPALQKLNLLFIAKIQEEQMNFPKSGGTRSFGTRVITGLLKRSWKESTITTRQSIMTRVWSTAPYAPMHENAEKDGTPTDGVYVVPEHTRVLKKRERVSIVKQHLVYFPKRLHVGEAWRTDYSRGYVKTVNRIFAEVFGS